MAKSLQAPAPAAADGIDDLAAITRQSFARISGAFSAWLRDTRRLQAEAMRFFNERMNKDVTMLTEFAACRKPEEVFELQARLTHALVSDYVAEGNRLLELYGEFAKSELDPFSNAMSIRL